MLDDSLVERAVRIADAGAVVAHGAGRQPMQLQQRETGNARVVLADPRIVEHAEQRPRRHCIARGRKSAVRAADGKAASVLGLELGDRMDDPH